MAGDESPHPSADDPLERTRPLERLADEDLMTARADAVARAFEVLYDRHARAAYSLAYRVLGSRGAAEEAVQDAFLDLWRSRARYRPERGSLRTWLLAITHKRSIDLVRRNAVQVHHQTLVGNLDEQREAHERTESEAIRRDESREVRAALSELPDSQRRVLELAYFGGFTHREIAGVLEEPLGTVKGRMRLGLEKLRDRLGEVA